MNPQEQIAQVIESEDFQALKPAEQADVLKRLEADLGLMGEQKAPTEPEGYPLDIYSNPIDAREAGKMAIGAIPPLMATGGAVGGGALGAMSPVPGGAYMGGVGGAAAGGGLGDFISNMMLQKLGFEQEKSMSQNIDSALGEAKTQALFQGVAGPAGKLLSLPGKGMTAEAAAVAKETAERGIPVSPKAINPGFMASAAQGIADLGPGRLWSHFKRMQIDPKMLQYRKEVIESLPGGGPGITDFKVISENLKQETKAAYTSMKEIIGKDGRINLNNTFDKIDVALDRVTDPGLKVRLEQFLKNGKNQTADQLDDFQKKFWSGLYAKSGNAKSTDAKIMGEVMEAMKADMAAFGESTGKDLLGTYLTAKSLSMTERATGSLRILFERSIKRQDGLAEHFNPGIFVQNFQKYEKQLEKALPAETYDAIKRFASVSQAVIGDYAKSKTSDAFVATAIGAGAAGGATFASPWLAVPSGFSLVMAKSLMNPKSGLMREWLAPIERLSPAAGEVLKLGGRAALSGTDAADVLIGNFQ